MKLYINGRFHSMEKEDRIFSALCEEDGKIADVGEAEALLSRYPEAEIFDLGGRTVIPGLIDTHTHVFMSADTEKEREMFIPRSIPELLDNLRERVEKAEKGEWIVYKNTYPLRIDELRYPTLSELDEIAPDNPVAVDGYYSSMLNSKAMEVIDYDKLPKGAEIERDDDGKMTGVFKCANPYIISFASFGKGGEKEATKRLMREYNKCGITMAIEGNCMPSDMELMKELFDAGEQTVRVRYTVPATEEVAQAAASVDTGDADFSRLCFLKNLLDGGFLSGTAFMEYPYKNLKEIFGIDTRGKDDFGIVIFTKEELVEKIRLARKYGLSYGAHCVGSAASKRLLAAYRVCNEEKPLYGERHALIHADFFDAEMARDANEMGISILFQPAWHYMDAAALDKVLSPEDAKRFMRYSEILKADLAAAGSDHMAKHSPDESVNPYNPFLGMYNMVTCISRDGKAYGEDSKVSRFDALSAYTREAARVCFDEEKLGTLTPGKYADFTVLSDDYFACDERDIPKIRATMTVVGGKRVI